MTGLFFLLGFLVSPAFADETPSTLDLDGRYQYSSTQRDLMAGTGIYCTHPFSWLETTAATRVLFSSKDFEAIAYQGEVRYPFSVFAVSARLSHSFWLPDSLSQSSLLFRGEVAGNPFSFLGLFAQFGWYERFLYLSKAIPFPTFVRVSARDHDFAMAAGIRVKPLDGWEGAFQIGTFDEIEVFNLNNPFFRLSVGYHPPEWDWTLTAYSRYRVLLGFGRLDELTFGVGARRNL